MMLRYASGCDYAFGSDYSNGFLSTWKMSRIKDCILVNWILESDLVILLTYVNDNLYSDEV